MMTAPMELGSDAGAPDAGLQCHLDWEANNLICNVIVQFSQLLNIQAHHNKIEVELRLRRGHLIIVINRSMEKIF